MSRSTPNKAAKEHWEQQLFSGLDPRHVWKNPLNPGSMRITNEANAWLSRQEKLTVYKFQIPELTNGQLVQLDHTLSSPYFLRNRKLIYLFGEQDAIMLSLHGGNLAQYLDNLAKN